MGVLGIGVDLAQDELVRDLDPSRLPAQPGEPSVAAILRCRRFAVADLLISIYLARVAAAAADIRPLPGAVVIVVEGVMVAGRLREASAGSCAGDK